jgi:hypothetical protein
MEEDRLTNDLRTALADVGIPAGRVAAFLRGETVVVTGAGADPVGIAVLQRVGTRLRCGIVSIRDPGHGHVTMLRFRGRCHALAARLGAVELELFGVAVINPKLEQVLLRRGFERRTGDIPDELGGGQAEILTRVFPVLAEPAR